MFFHLDAYKLREMYENEVDGIISHTFHFHLMEFNKMTTSLVSLQVLTLEKVDKITLISTLEMAPMEHLEEQSYCYMDCMAIINVHMDKFRRKAKAFLNTKEPLIFTK